MEQIPEIRVYGEGSHTLYLWLYDEAGNSGYQKPMAVTLSYDRTPPWDAWITASAGATPPQIEVFWGATDAVSGILSYTVEYRQGLDSTWQKWLTSTTETSAPFTAPRVDTDYAFRVTAYDLALNSTRAESSTRVYVEPWRAYLPLFLHRGRAWYGWPYDEDELNDTPADARNHEPLRTYQDHKSYIWNQADPNDYYRFVSDTTGEVRIELTNIRPGEDYDLDLYVREPAAYNIIASSEGIGRSERTGFRAKLGVEYFIQVYPRGKFSYSSTQPYYLRIEY